jgi:transposase
MRKIREILRLHYELELSARQIATSCLIGRDTVRRYVERAHAINLVWPPPETLDDQALERLLFRNQRSAVQTQRLTKHPMPDWNSVERELKRKGVTLVLLHREYLERHPNGYCYSRFAQRFIEWKRSNGLAVTMRQTHKAGDKLFVDYAGMTVPITDRATGEINAAQVFVATLGASNYTYAEITATQNLEDWLGAHRRALEYFGGVPRLIVPDNLKTGVTSPHRYEPEINRAYTEFAEHYGVAVIPARVKKPRDKAKVEVHVQVVERHLLAPLRNRTFFSLAEANHAIAELLEALNTKPFQKLEGSRRSAFLEIDQPELRPLPLAAYAVSQWRKAKVGIDYHVEVEGHYYSVPYRFARSAVEVRLAGASIEVFHDRQRIAVHSRVPNLPRFKGRHSTITEHMPKAHQRYGEWNAARLIDWAHKTGPSTARVIEAILEARTHPEQGFRSCLGIMRLGKSFGVQRLEAACKRADALRAYSFKSVQSILQNNLDLEPSGVEEVPTRALIAHQNLRGAAYYKRDVKTEAPERNV